MDNEWAEWKKSSQALLNSEAGGMMGDPYGGLEIKNGILLISHGGGSNWKWTNTDKYRFQGDAFYGCSSLRIKRNGSVLDYWSHNSQRSGLYSGRSPRALVQAGDFSFEGRLVLR